jgi:cytochrome c
MQKILIVITGAALALGAALPSAAADAAKAEALAKQYNCLQCHTADKKILGPAYKEVAAKYKGNKDAQALLAKNVKAGSKGTWGPIPMPPNDKLSDADVATLVEWILSM